MAITSLSIVIPAYNEADNITDCVAAVLRDMIVREIDFEIILINDGSNDGTGRIIDMLSANDSRITALHHPTNAGKGSALAAGFSRARKDWVLFLDADGQVPFSEVSRFLSAAAPGTLVIGCRVRRADPLMRRIPSWAFNMLVRSTLGLWVRDVNCPFKLIPRGLLDRFHPQSSGFFIDAELLHRAASLGVGIREIPVPSRRREKGSSSVRFGHIFQTLRELISLVRRTYRGPVR